MKKTFLVSCVLGLTLLMLSPSPLFGAQKLDKFLTKPKLVLVLVYDQFRADYLTRFHSRFLPARLSSGKPGGYRALMSQGAYYPFAEYPMFQNMTGPGHATILSGSLPARNGIALNRWYDPTAKRKIYCVEDEKYQIITNDGPLKDAKGMSPKTMKGNTLGDELKNAGYDSKVVTIALKDRAAIFMGGTRPDLALWLEHKSLQWSSSTYYLKDSKLPPYLISHNQKLGAKKGKPYVWKFAGKPSGLTLSLSEESQRSYEMGSRDSYGGPFGIEITTDLAIDSLKSLHLGKDATPDLMAVSFSSHDYLGHAVGPNSIEMEEMTLFEDRELSRLLGAVETQVPGGLKNVMIVLTADHGIPPSPKWLESFGLPAGQIPIKEWLQSLESKFSEKYGKAPENSRWIVEMEDFQFYLNKELITLKDLDLEEVSQTLKTWVLTQKGIETAFTQGEFFAQKLPNNLLGSQIRAGYFPDRGGQVVAIPLPFYQLDEDNLSHLSGHTYDRMVPLILFGSSFVPGVYAQKAHVTDIAPTLAFLLGVLPPSLSEGRVLSETIQ